jgi:asparagine synthase (glutamine-hydrolysing)
VCGIAGFLAPRGSHAEASVVERMLATLRHRGPDALGWHVDGRVALGATRLRIMDRERGDQPLADEEKTVHVVHNGEIYNLAELRRELGLRGHRFTTRCDTEALLHAWREYGERCVDRLNGMFAFAVWDQRRRTLCLARDRMGEKPLYYTWAHGWFVFASELRGVLAHPAVDHELDLAALSRYLAYDFVPDPHSIVRGVAKLPPGHLLTVRDEQATLRRYWDIPFDPDDGVSEERWCEAVRARLDDAVRLRLASDAPLGCFLSGGVDSTAITATVARHRTGVRTFSVGFDEPRYDERRFSRAVVRRYATRHEELVVTAGDAAAVVANVGALLDEPLADTSFVPLHLLARAARPSVTVALTGDGGDELFAGYRTMPVERWHARVARLPASVRRALRRGAAAVPGLPESFRRFLMAIDYPRVARNQALLGGLPAERHRPLLAPGVRAELGAFDPYDDVADALAACPSPDAGDQLIYYYCKFFLAGQNLANADRASMAASLELRAPLLDHLFVELVGRIPSRLKLSGFGALKRLFKAALADRLPPEVMARGKHGFGVPMGAWLRRGLADIVREVLAPARVRAGGFFDAAVVARLVDEHLAGIRDHERVLWSLLVFESWRARQLERAVGA